MEETVRDTSYHVFVKPPSVMDYTRTVGLYVIRDEIGHHLCAEIVFVIRGRKSEPVGRSYAKGGIDVIDMVEQLL